MIVPPSPQYLASHAIALAVACLANAAIRLRELQQRRLGTKVKDNAGQDS